MILDLHPSITGMHGKTGKWVFKKLGETSYAADKPKPSDRLATPAQQGVRDKFSMSADYAKSVLLDPASLAIYEPVADSRNKTVYRVAMNDALINPTVTEIDSTEYARQAGDKITVRALDDFGVHSVTVTLTNSTTSQVVETGEALKTNDSLGRWVYTATTTVPGGTPVKVDVAAFDRPGNKGTKSETVN